MKKRNIFAEISEGFDALKLARHLEATAHERLPAVTPPPVPRRSSLVRMPRHRQGEDESEAMAMKRFALCLSNNFGDEFSDADVFPGVAYETLGEERGTLRIVDESGEDFLYPSKHFLLLNDAQSAQLAQGLLLGGVRSRCTPNVKWHDPIVEELHEIRTQLLERHGGDLHALSEAALARALALGFQFTTIKARGRKDATVLSKKTSATA